MQVCRALLPESLLPEHCDKAGGGALLPEAWHAAGGGAPWLGEVSAVLVAAVAELLVRGDAALVAALLSGLPAMLEFCGKVLGEDKSTTLWLQNQ